MCYVHSDGIDSVEPCVVDANVETFVETRPHHGIFLPDGGMDDVE